MNDKKENWIAVIDSGVGGISVLAEARKVMPGEDFLFYADKANAPYGDKTTEEIRTLMEKHCRRFLSRGAKAILIACNTATSASAKYLRDILPIPVLGMEPALKPAVTEIDGQVVVLATRLTIREEKFQKLLETYGNGKDVVPLACPGLMELVENDPDGQETEAYLLQMLQPYASSMQALVLGCTHYVFLRPLLQRLYPGVSLFDGNYGVCKHLYDTLQERRVNSNAGSLHWDCSIKDVNERTVYLEKCRMLYDRLSHKQVE